MKGPAVSIHISSAKWSKCKNAPLVAGSYAKCRCGVSRTTRHSGCCLDATTVSFAKIVLIPLHHPKKTDDICKISQSTSKFINSCLETLSNPSIRLGLNWQIFKVVWFNDYIHENITGSFTIFFGKIRCFYRFHAFPRGSDQMSTSVCIQWGYLLHNMWKRGTITACSIFKSYHDTSSS